MTAIDLDPIRQRHSAYTSAYSQGGWRDAAWQAGESADDVPGLIAEVEHYRDTLEDLAKDCEAFPEDHPWAAIMTATAVRLRLILAGERP